MPACTPVDRAMNDLPDPDASAGIVDAHFHCWRLARGDYGWLTPALHPIHRDVTVADWEAVSRPRGVAGGVLVQAAPTEAETDFLLAQAQAHSSVLGVVGSIDWLAADAPRRVEALARRPRLVGLRPMLQDLPDPDWILQPALAPVLDAMAACGLAFDALVKPVHLARVRRLVDRHPGLRIVIDHGAKPDIAAGAWQPWAADMAALARETEVFCKLSGLLTEAGSRTADADLRPYVDHLLACFGPTRLMWGSDWPVLNLAGDYGGWLEQASRLVQSLGADEQAQIFGLTAARFYRLTETP